MPRRVAIAAAVGSVLISGSFAAAQGARAGETTVPDAARALQQVYPGARVHMDQGRVRVIYGVPMTWAGTPDAAAAQFLQFHGRAFGAGPLTLREAWSTPVQNGRFTAYAYNQDIDGMPVEYGNARILVLNGAVPRVVYAAGTLAAKPAGGWPLATVNGPQALQMVQSMEAYGGLPVYTTPMAAVWQSEGTTTKAHRAWKFQGYIPGIGGNKSLTFFVDMATGDLLEARNEVLETDVTGTVRGWATPGNNPDFAGNAPVLTPMPEIQMSIQGGSNAFSERDGDFTIPNPGTSAVTVTSNLSGGRWVNVNPTGATELSLNLPGVVPPGNINPQYNTPQPTPTNSPNTAQVNAFVHTNNIHNYYKDRAPGFTPIDVVIPANTGVAGTCNAFFTTSPVPSINFYNFGGGCNNTAYSSVVAHEYGHFVVNRLGLAQGAFGEGFSDVGALLLFDFGIIGPNFYTSGAFIRDPGGANQGYPCSGGGHQCGMTIGGIWWETLVLFKGAYGSAPGLENTRDLQVAWSQITTGGSGSNSAHPATAIEILTVDDDDGNIGNGTPNHGMICNAFNQHGISCPPLTLVGFQYPNGLPLTLTPNENTTVRVDVVPVAGTPVANSGFVAYSIGPAAFQSVQMNTVGTNQYEAVIPGVPCATPVRFYFSVSTTSAGVVTDPPTAPAAYFSTVSATGIANILTDTFETSTGWSGVAPGDNATTGRWNRMDPQPTAAQPGDDVTPAPGVACWVTDGNSGTGIGSFDVDSGITTLTSPALDLSGTPEAKVSYWRWYSNDQNGTIDDTFNVGISNNNGTSWTNVETLGPTGTQSVGGWLFKEFRVADFVTPTAQVRVRFVAADVGLGSIVEAAVDDFKVVEILCGAPCYPDCDGVNGLNVADFGCFQTKFVAGDPYADCDGVNGLTVADFGCFQTKFVAGCP
jgi:hypothetical protein